MALLVCDTSCLITLERVDRLPLISAVFPDAVVPTTVAEEFGTVPDWLPVREVEDQRLVKSLRAQLDPGEADTLALAMEIDADVLVDEKKARRIARDLGLSVVGTLGLLLRAKQQGSIQAVRPLMDALIAADFRISDSLYEDVLRRANE
jgi:predicted nucleic acid-binding protein